jgi:hypothetical protein
MPLWGRFRRLLMLEQSDTAAHEHCGQPTAPIDPLMQQPLRGHRIADEGERTRCGGDEANIRVAEGEEQREEAESHKDNPGEEAAFTDHGPDSPA